MYTVKSANTDGEFPVLLELEEADSTWFAYCFRKVEEDSPATETLAEKTARYNPFERHEFERVSEDDMEYLRGTPQPLKITIPIMIEENKESKFTDFQPGEWVTPTHYNNGGSLGSCVWEGKYQVADGTPYWDQSTIKLVGMGDCNFPSKQFRRCNAPTSLEQMTAMEENANVIAGIGKPKFSPREFMEAARQAGASCLGIENDPESCEVLDKMAAEQKQASFKNVTEACLHPPSDKCPDGCGCWCDICEARRKKDVEFLVVPENGIALSKSCGFNTLEHAIGYASKEETPCIIFTATHKVIPTKVTKIGG